MPVSAKLQSKFRRWAAVPVLIAALAGSAFSGEPRELHLGTGGGIRSLDPVLAADSPSRDMTAAFYDTLLEYAYPHRPVRLRPAMLAEMPRSDASGKIWRLRLRDDLEFIPDACFRAGDSRRIGARDVVFSLLRLADTRLSSPVYWVVRGKIEGLDAFRTATARAPDGDFTVYDRGIPGLRVLSERELEIRLTAPDPRFPYLLALPWTAVVPRRAVEFYGAKLGVHPVGSGPFRLTRYRRDYELVLERNPQFRRQFFPEAQTPADRTRPLPLADRILCRVVKQPMAAWLMFLQGKFDLAALDKDNLDLAANARGELAPALARRGIRLLRIPEFEIRYVGFNLSDPVLRDPRVREAIALVYDLDRRAEFYNYQMVPAAGPVPPGIAGAKAGLSPLKPDLAHARKLLAAAGYPGGLDPKTGEPLTLQFDQAGSTPQHRQLGELAVSDLAKLGIRVVNNLNSRPRFVEKLRNGSCQLFRYSWVGDYPDAENFLQLFYTGNRGGNNYAGYSNAEFDRDFERIRPMPDSPERTRIYERMADRVIADRPWIFEGIPISCLLAHGWLENYHAYEFAFNRWKYLTADPAARTARSAGFTPLDFGDLR